MPHDVFVSYSSKDKVIADSVVAAMEQNGIRCWYAPRDIKPSEDWGKAISSAIEQSRVFLVIFSNHANRSQRVLDEVNLAISNQAVLLPFRIENLEPDGAMKLHLSSRHWLDAYDPSWESHIKALIKNVSIVMETAIDEENIKLPVGIFKKEKRQKKKIGRILGAVSLTAILILAGIFGVPLLKPEEAQDSSKREADASEANEMSEEQQSNEIDTAESTGEQATPEVYDIENIESVCSTDAYGCAKIEPGETIKIGMSTPLSGQYENWGMDAKQSGLLAVSDAGNLQGFKFELIAKDDKGTPEGGASAAEEFVTDPTVVAIAGHTFSPSTAAAMPIYEENGLPILSYSASNPGFLESGSNVYSQLCYSDKILGFRESDFIFNTLEARRIAILHSNDDYGKGVADNVKTGFIAAGGEVTSYGDINLNPDWLNSIFSEQTDLVYYCGLEGGADVLEKVKSNADQEIPFFGCDVVGLNVLNQESKNAEGSYFSFVRESVESEEKDSFDEKYLKAFGINPGVLSQYTYYSYDSARILTEMVKEVGMLGEDNALYIPRGALVKAVRGLKDYTGISGNYSCGNIGDCNVEGPMIAKVEGGELAPLE